LLPPKPALKKGKRFLVGYVGVIGKQEGIDLFLESVAYIRGTLQRNDIQYVIVGGGTEIPALREMAKTLRIDDCVDFTGRVSDAELWQTLNTADACVNPDRYNEMNDKSTMNKILEYMALGKPIVQFELTEGRFSAGEASLYAEPNNVRDFGEKLVALLDDPALREQMGKIGRARVENELSWQHQVPRLLAAYELALAPRRTVRALDSP
jgi:glycosyltransferase involved in cell wall biosynthesis